MSWVKTLLHEAFHANLKQRSYELFGSPEIALWLKKPEDMTLEELMDKMENVIQTEPQLAILHHNNMAENIEIIKNGLKSFSLANNTKHSDFEEDHFTALAYEGLNTTLYYLNNVVKDGTGNDRMGTYKGNVVTLTQAFFYNSKDLKSQSIIPCN